MTAQPKVPPTPVPVTRATATPEQIEAAERAFDAALSPVLIAMFDRRLAAELARGDGEAA